MTPNEPKNSLEEAPKAPAPKKVAKKKSAKKTAAKKTTRKATSPRTGGKPANEAEIKAAEGKDLIIVESPAKARTIEKFLGGQYTVAASYGHIRDLPSTAAEIPAEIKPKSWSRMAVDVEGDFTPYYVVTADSRARVNELKKMAKVAKRLLLATDEDREGESISWHLLEVLKPTVPVQRITFHEITRSAIEEALRNPHDLNHKLVRAQESRRILDRLYGYTLSPIIWKKVRTKLSAGRVQSVAVRLIVEREEERLAFKSVEYWDVTADLKAGDLGFQASLFRVGEQRLAAGKDFDPAVGKLKADSNALHLDRTRAESIAAAAKAAVPWRVGSVERKQTKQRPYPPFTTSTLQQAASSFLGMAPRQTMMVAQRLYEGVDLGGSEREGLITYMRTDSVTLSEKALGESERFIKSKFGDPYHTGWRRYQTKSKSAQEAHEAIRPTLISRTPDSMKSILGKDELALYRLIWNRTVASQMADAELDKTSVEFTAGIQGVDHVFRANGSVIRFDGYLRVSGGVQKDAVLPELSEGQTVGGPGAAAQVAALTPVRHDTSPPARYSEASLIKKLEEEGIGRPSTYAPTISTIQAREYVDKKGNALTPTFLGMAVVSLLRKHFSDYVDVGFTARMEDDLDNIATGDKDWIEFLKNFYRGGNGRDGLLETIDKELPGIDYPAIPIGNDPQSGDPIVVRIGRSHAFMQRGEGGEGNRVTLPEELTIEDLTLDKALDLLRTAERANEPLGVDPETGKNIYLLVGPYGPYIQLGEVEEGGDKPKRVGLPRGTDPHAITMEFTLKLLALPRELGTDPETGKKVTAGLGRYGPYVERARVYKNLPNLEKIFDVTLEEAIELVNTKTTKEVLKEVGDHPESGKAVQVLSGRYGPYVTDGKLNASLPKDMDPKSLEMTQAVAMLAEASTKKKAPRRRRS